MTYRELLEFTKKHPNCFWSKEQKDQNSDYRYKSWVATQNRDYEGEAAKEKGHR